MNKKTRAIIYVVAWVGVTFYFSSQQGEVSSSQSMKILSYIVEPIIAKMQLPIQDWPSFWETVHFLIRKAAHVTEYFVLSMLIYNMYYQWDVAGRRKYVFTGLSTVFFASLDEFHQLFIAGRAGSIKDVGIDSIGFVLLLIILLIKDLIIRRKERIRS